VTTEPMLFLLDILRSGGSTPRINRQEGVLPDVAVIYFLSLVDIRPRELVGYFFPFVVRPPRGVVQDYRWVIAPGNKELGKLGE